MRWAVELIDASGSKKASKTPACAQTVEALPYAVQGPKRSGRARQRTFSTVKK
jgi:hypothetical protein